MFINLRKSGISPVIGVILLIALTVALISIVTFIVFDASSDVSQSSSSSTVQTITSDDSVEVQVVRNNDNENFEVISPSGEVYPVSGRVGNSISISDGEGTYAVRAILPDGSEEVINTVNVNNSDSLIQSDFEESTGTVSINPDIEGAMVKSMYNGTIIDETTTDDEGVFTIEYLSGSDIIVTVDGFEHEDLDFDLFASARIAVLDEMESIDFRFENEMFAVVDGESVIVSNTIEGDNTQYIGTVEQLQAIRNDLSNDYEIISDIDASDTEDWNNNDGFAPIGNYDNGFDGTLNGNGHEISGLHIDRDTDPVGLFGNNNGIIKNINLLDVNIYGDFYVGGISGQVDNDGSIKNVSVSGEVNSLQSSSGGPVGLVAGVVQPSGELINSSTKGIVTGGSYVGGVVGQGDVSDSFANVNIFGGSEFGTRIGGLSGEGTVEKSYSIGDVDGNGSEFVGGLVGSGSSINSYASGNVSNGDSIGGLAGRIPRNGEISNSYASGIIEGGSANEVGGLTGKNREGIIEESIFVGEVNGENNVASIVSNNYNPFDTVTPIVRNSYGDNSYTPFRFIDNDGEIDNVINLNTDEMQGESAKDNMDTLDFENKWKVVDDDYPILRWE